MEELVEKNEVVSIEELKKLSDEEKIDYIENNVVSEVLLSNTILSLSNDENKVKLIDENKFLLPFIQKYITSFSNDDYKIKILDKYRNEIANEVGLLPLIFCVSDVYNNLTTEYNKEKLRVFLPKVEKLYKEEKSKKKTNKPIEKLKEGLDKFKQEISTSKNDYNSNDVIEENDNIENFNTEINNDVENNFIEDTNETMTSSKPEKIEYTFMDEERIDPNYSWMDSQNIRNLGKTVEINETEEKEKTTIKEKAEELKFKISNIKEPTKKLISAVKQKISEKMEKLTNLNEKVMTK